MAARFRTVREGLPHPLIQFDETGMAFTAWHADGSASKTELAWNEVNGVVAYKRDCYAIDLDGSTDDSCKAECLRLRLRRT